MARQDIDAARRYPIGAPRVAVVEAELAVLDGKPDQAVGILRTALANCSPAALRLHGNHLVAVAVRAASDLADPVPAAELRAWLDLGAGVVADLEDRGGVPLAQRAWHSAALAWATSGAEAVAAWRQAVTSFTDAEMQLEAARARIQLAAALVRVGARDEAAAELATAAEVAGAQHARATAMTVDDLRRRARLRRSGEQGSAMDRFALTRRELEVIRLVAEGLTNLEIGKHLFISEKTASVHVSNAMRKLGVDNRRAAARIVRDLGLG